MSTPMEGVEDSRTPKKRERGGDDRNPGSNSPAVSKKKSIFRPPPQFGGKHRQHTRSQNIFVSAQKILCHSDGRPIRLYVYILATYQKHSF